MPAWGNILSQEEIAALVNLIRRWDTLSDVDLPQKVPVAVKLVHQGNVAKYGDFGKADSK